MFLIKTDPTFTDYIPTIKEYQFKKLREPLRFIPDNFGEILINLGPIFTRQSIGSIRATPVKTGEIICCGCRSKGITLSGENIHFISAKISPEYIQCFSPADQSTERDQMKSLGVFPFIHSRVQFIQYLKDQLKKQPSGTPNFVIHEALHLIRQSKGEIKVKEITDQLGVSKSYLEQRFSQQIGLSPKEFCKIEKLKCFLDNYRKYQDCMNLTQLTFKSGYYDQSHLIKDFKYFLDARPKEFMKMAGVTF